jgi:hypothetical protein
LITLEIARTVPRRPKSAYRSRVLGRLQDTRGTPRLRVRLLAGTIVFGLVVFTAPVIMIPFIGWLAHHL